MWPRCPTTDLAKDGATANWTEEPPTAQETSPARARTRHHARNVEFLASLPGGYAIAFPLASRLRRSVSRPTAEPATEEFLP